MRKKGRRFTTLGVVIWTACWSLAAFVAVVLLGGCAHRSVEYEGAIYTSNTLFSDTAVGDIEIVIEPDGTRRVIVHGFSSEQIETAEAIAEGATRGAIKALVPAP